MADRDQLLDIKQAAEFLRVSETSLRRWTNAGELACLRVGRKRERRFRRADLLAFMEEQPALGFGGGRAGNSTTDRALGDRTAVTPGNHLCGLYRSDQGRARLAASFLIADGGLHSGSACFLVALPEVREQILAHLGAEHPTLEQDIGTGRLLLSVHHDSADAQHHYWQTHFTAALRDGARTLRVVSDMSGLLHAFGARALVDYEAEYGRFVSPRYPVATLCLYDVRVFSALDIRDTLEVHTDILRFPAEQLLA
jgi:transcriptional repressor of dcmA and dcmR